jgi:hypothetical protein
MQTDWTALGKVLAMGGALFWGVQKFFDVVGDKLNEDTRLEIAVWLLGVKVGQKVEPWPETVVTLFDRVFGPKHWSWKCFSRSICASSLVFLIAGCITITFAHNGTNLSTWPLILSLSLPMVAGMILVYSILSDYGSLLKTRFLLSQSRRFNSSLKALACPAIDLLASYCIAAVSLVVVMAICDGYISFPFTSAATIGDFVRKALDDYPAYLSLAPKIVFHSLATMRIPANCNHCYSDLDFNASSLAVYPVFAGSIWLWLYAGAGFVLKAARRFDIGFEWFNRHFDIEKKPLQSIGLVAGVLVAVVYWTAVIVARVLG